MQIDGKPWRTIWRDQAGGVGIIDQTCLPHSFETLTLASLQDAAVAIRTMQVRGAPLIGAAAAYGLALGLDEDPTDIGLERAHRALAETRPTAINLRWALGRVVDSVCALLPEARAERAFAEADAIAEEDVAINAALGRFGAELIKEIASKKPGRTVNILTHCNAGWLATVDWGTATAPIYQAFQAGIPLHVWVDETRPRNQGAFLTAWELNHAGVPHTVIADNAGGHLMQHGQVDLAIVGTDRTTRTGDVCNKIGTYLKALAAHDCGVPFYVALPSSTIDWTLTDGRAIPIEERAGTEVSHISGRTADGRIVEVQLTPNGSGVANPGFDVTPARLITGLITERGIAPASAEGLAALFPERARTRAA
ncbi:S-methyl-5-thioribose-1-phosphate isomerase [Blastochloris sulfoviridis]|uniref:Methylthioribose-1-phosphate isomerase n=1 Tax=Blastochloris sulfoviridis TaxID=50712 RepID=A0A5M6HXT7_9HYPH|nr:S-methyl-5-thioribose-1-phosphate isomerase [Blastochloris sulfoviridis]KAA5600447.1 S-methyl-5-thioribose-1-phosphate isomerase [Blastochloris sulfoviridis]